MDRVKKHFPSILQLLGLVILAVAGYLIHLIVGLTLTGLFVFGFGYLMERPLNVPKHP